MEVAKDENEREIVHSLCKEDPSIKDVAMAVRLIITKMWSEDRMEAFVESRHNELCKSCPRAANQKAGWKLVTSLVATIGTLGTALGAIVTHLLGKQ